MRLSAASVSVVLHGAAVLFVLWLFRAGLIPPRTPLSHIPLVIPIPSIPAHRAGGGQREILPASLGNLPPRARRQLMPLTIHSFNDHARMTVQPAILLEAPDIPMPHVAVDRLGSPFGVDGPLSGGPGGPGGIGGGTCCGVGNDSGNGVQGTGPPAGTRPLRGEVRVPVLLYKTEPEYSEEARKAKVQGTVVLTAEVDPTGRLRNIRVTRPLGLGLDERAIGAVAQWRFRPAMNNGHAVPFSVTIEVNFRLL